MYFFFKAKTAYLILISEWSNGVIPSVLDGALLLGTGFSLRLARNLAAELGGKLTIGAERLTLRLRSEEHTSELQSLMRISYAVFCLKKKKDARNQDNRSHANAARKRQSSDCSLHYTHRTTQYA